MYGRLSALGIRHSGWTVDSTLHMLLRIYTWPVCNLQANEMHGNEQVTFVVMAVCHDSCNRLTQVWLAHKSNYKYDITSYEWRGPSIQPKRRLYAACIYKYNLHRDRTRRIRIRTGTGVMRHVRTNRMDRWQIGAMKYRTAIFEKWTQVQESVGSDPSIAFHSDSCRRCVGRNAAMCNKN